MIKKTATKSVITVSKFCSLTGFCTRLEDDLDSTHTLVCVNVGKIASALKNKHTYMVISDGLQCEHIRVTCQDGKLVALERGVGWTDPVDWPKGTLIKFDWTDEAFSDAYDCILEEDSDNDSENCDIKIGDKVYKYTGTDDDGVKCYEQEGEDLEICGPKEIYTIKNIDYTTAVNPNQLADGVFQNATITVKDCKIIAITEGSKPTLGGCSPGCSCTDCQNTNTDPV